MAHAIASELKISLSLEDSALSAGASLVFSFIFNSATEFSIEVGSVDSDLKDSVSLAAGPLGRYFLCLSLFKVAMVLPAFLTEFWSTVNWMAAAAA